MSGEVVKMDEWSLQQYAEEINEQYAALLRAEEVAENAIFNIGRLLNEVKAKLSHGEFIPWVEANCRFNQRWAQRLMTIERRKEEFIEPPTTIKGALTELKRIDEMRSVGRISTSLPIPYDNPRNKLYGKMVDIHDYLNKVREEGYHKYMVIEDEKGVMAEILLRIADLLRTMRNEIDPSGSHIREVE